MENHLYHACSMEYCKELCCLTNDVHYVIRIIIPGIRFHAYELWFEKALQWNCMVFLSFDNCNAYVTDENSLFDLYGCIFYHYMKMLSRAYDLTFYLSFYHFTSFYTLHSNK